VLILLAILGLVVTLLVLLLFQRVRAQLIYKGDRWRYNVNSLLFSYAQDKRLRILFFRLRKRKAKEKKGGKPEEKKEGKKKRAKSDYIRWVKAGKRYLPELLSLARRILGGLRFRINIISATLAFEDPSITGFSHGIYFGLKNSLEKRNIYLKFSYTEDSPKLDEVNLELSGSLWRVVLPVLAFAIKTGIWKEGVKKLFTKSKRRSKDGNGNRAVRDDSLKHREDCQDEDSRR